MAETERRDCQGNASGIRKESGASVFRWFRRVREQDIQDELDYHLAMLTQEGAAGEPPGEARGRALRKLGNRTAIQEKMRWRALDGTRRNARYTFRTMRGNPAFSALVVLTMALGIGAATLIFAILSTVALRPLPYRDPARIVFLWENKRDLHNERVTVAPANYRDWKRSNHVLSDMALIEGERFRMTDGAGTRWVRGLAVTSGFFSLLGAHPRIGRTPQSSREVLLSHSFWSRNFGHGRDVIGKPIALSGRTYFISGVMPEDFYFPEFGGEWEVWTTLELTPEAESNRDAHCCGAIGRIRPGIHLAQARREMSGIAAHLARDFPETNRGAGVTLTPAPEQAAAATGRTVAILALAVGLLLLIACVNVATLLLVRSAARQKEIGLRLALGASRKGVFGQLLTESLILAACGSIVGLAAACALLPILRSIPVDLPRWTQISVDWRVCFFAVGATAATGVLFGLAPAFETLRLNLNGVLLGSGKNDTAAGHRGSRVLLPLLVAGQIAIAFVLVAGAGLLTRSLADVLGVNAGFRAANVLTATVTFPAGTKPPGLEGFLAQVERLPGVRSAGWTTNLPIGGSGWGTYFAIEGRPVHPGEVLGCAQMLVSTAYFKTMGIPLVAGRVFGPEDQAGKPLAAVINDVLAKRYFPGQNPLGRRVKWGRENDAQYPEWFTIVGVVGAVRDKSLEVQPQPELYMAIPQMAGALAGFAPDELSLVALHLGDARSLARAWLALAAEPDRGITITNVAPMAEILSRSLISRKFNLSIIGAFAALAVCLSSIGVYGLIAYLVSLRRHEIGIRIALGSGRPAILRLVLREAFLLALGGILTGIVLSWMTNWLLVSWLFGVSPQSPVILLLSAATLGAAALFGSFLPAARAANSDPMASLRSE